MHPDPYWLGWGSAALLFSIGGGALLLRASRQLEFSSNRHTPASTPYAILFGPTLAAGLTLIGAKLHVFAGHPQTLLLAWQEGSLWTVLTSSGQRISGGLFLAALFLGFVWPRQLRSPLSGTQTLDLLAPLSGVSIALGRLGCFAAGCCFGIPCNWVWGVSHSRASPAWWNHVAQGQILESDPLSLPVHPLPLYLAIASLLASLVALWASRKEPKPGIAALTFILVFCGTRLLIEPWRETLFLRRIPGQTFLDGSLLLLSAVGLAMLRKKSAA